MNQTPKKKYRANFNGYRPTHRNKWLMIAEGWLTLQEVMLLEYYADQTVFDPSKSETYGSFVVNIPTISKIFRKSNNTIRNWHNGLQTKGLIHLVEKPNVYQLASFQRYMNPGRWKGKAGEFAHSEKNQWVEHIFQLIGVSPQIIEQTAQQVAQSQSKNLKKSQSKALSSFKDQSKVNLPRSYKDYTEMYKDNDYQGMTPDDMAWVDHNVS